MHYLTLIAVFLINCYLGQAVNVYTNFEWNYINYSWSSGIDYNYAVYKKYYVPENNIPSTIKVHNGKLYIALGRIYSGTPVTLASINYNKNSKSPVLNPFPSWDMNVKNDCSTLQNVNNFAIDSKNIMWIIDGIRNNNLTECPPKLILYNLNSKSVILNYTFPDDLTNRCFLSDITVDGNYAYIADNSDVDPGLIIYSRIKNRSWKIRDASMFPQTNAVKFTVGSKKLNYFSGIYGIALSPAIHHQVRYLYFNPISSFNIYSISTNVLKDETYCKTSEWRKYVYISGKKIDQSQALIIDGKGNLYFGLLNVQAIAKWNVYKKFQTAAIVYKNKILNWISSFAFDGGANLLILTNGRGRYLLNDYSRDNRNINFRVLKLVSK